ncbi:MAG TPA: hypothetical protein PK079_16640 [Leptospiraceae bacterium]|nr:hypothetical protein [Leptospiraceae bacterium]HMW07160.1 hypothetical protein [Leptospiraceae bacterium]HMX34583.1 hypothetical protein [Leptospiraceae bacterium]HMY32776.1 hypothetical protein [Leptospiraceae bacterium]HMZ65021.1 hypothetical protein [Leptospiraceae bacterium]
MNLELKDELELNTKYKFGNEKEISEIIKLFQFSNLNLIISNPEGEIFFASNSFYLFSHYTVKEAIRENIETILGKSFDMFELEILKRELECFSVRRTLKTKWGKKIEVNTYSSILHEFQNIFIVTIIIPAPVM